ncbi:MAG: hypothetical protein SVY41_03050 [Candidatus Nanohaloarchaea archaeon]|nr:hypothetical protein [Candidatus Nanohaloarchaea archaeon]
MEDALRVLKNTDRPLSTNEVADEMDVDWHTARKRLEVLVDQGDAHRSVVSNRLTLYWDREIPF